MEWQKAFDHRFLKIFNNISIVFKVVSSERAGWTSVSGGTSTDGHWWAGLPEVL